MRLNLRHADTLVGLGWIEVTELPCPGTAVEVGNEGVRFEIIRLIPKGRSQSTDERWATCRRA
jgi:hypothetical protein